MARFIMGILNKLYFVTLIVCMCLSKSQTASFSNGKSCDLAVWLSKMEKSAVIFYLRNMINMGVA